MAKTISKAELIESLREALDNWDFTACSHYGAEQREALERALANPEMLCDTDPETGEEYYEISGKDIWDSLSLYAESTAPNIAEARNQA